MKAILAVLGWATLVLGQTRYQCDLPAEDWEYPNSCLRLDSTTTTTYNVIDIRPCVSASAPYCPATTNIAEGAEIPCSAAPTAFEILTVGTVVPGMPCSSDAVCISGTCNMGYCAGAPSGQSCATNGDNDCAPGLYCDETPATPVCTELLIAGSACTKTTECQMNTGCNGSVCMAFYSLDVGEKDADCGNVGTKYIGFPLPVGSPDNYSVYCKSGTCTAGVCTFALHSSTALPVTCTTEQANPCAINNSAPNEVSTINSFTKCVGTSYNPTGTTYCAVEIGDPVFVTFIQWVTGTWAPLVSGSPQSCHTSQRGINTDCLKRLGGQYLVNSYTLVQQNAINYALYQDTDACTVQVFLPSYFSAQQYNAFCDTAFQCAANNTAMFTNNVGCIKQTPSSNFNIRPCTDPINTVCPTVHIYQANAEVECIPGPGQSASPTGLLPGDLCTSNGQCLSNICSGGMCVGVGSAGLCPNGDSDCNPGFYCSSTSGKCAALIPAGSTTTACTSSSQCVMNAGCNFDPITGLGLCTAYYSVPKDGSVSDCGQASFIQGMGNNPIPQGSATYVKYSALCSSGTCSLTTGNMAGANAGTCVSAYQSQGPLPQTCNFGPIDCPMKNADNSQTYGQCSCGMSNTQKTRYCSVDFGDQPWMNFMSWVTPYFANFTTYYSTSCHTYRRAFDQICMQKIGGTPRIMQFQEAWNFANNYATIVNADNCTKAVYNSAYWTAYQYNRPYLPDEISAAAWLGFAVLLLAY